MTNNLLIYGKIFEHFFNCSTLNFPIYEENFIFFFIIVGREHLVYLLPDKRVQPDTAPAARQPLAGEYAAHLRAAALLARFHLNP